ncbi:MAG TPA: carbamate kinase [Thermodesulfovibrionales bacterium]|nr:carbamate kinase [Thermodesulfovibrionales bacterium]
MSSEGVLIALGGNALILPGERGYIEEQFTHTAACMKPVAALVSEGKRIVITHGNGPIVGNILLRNECARDYIPPMPLSVCVADSQGGIGAMMVQSLRNELKGIGIEKTVSAIITHVAVDMHDPAFTNPTKPIGPYYPDEQVVRERQTSGWTMKRIPGRGWRRLVASPMPRRIVETEAIRAALEIDILPIACGGGGIPVIEEEGILKGVDAVIDKDFTAGLLCREIGMKTFVIVTDVDGVYLNWDSSSRRRIHSFTMNDAKRYLGEGQFPAGSMGPKIEAAIAFLESGGDEVLITRPEDLLEALRGNAGTRIIV